MQVLHVQGVELVFLDGPGEGVLSWASVPVPLTPDLERVIHVLLWDPVTPVYVAVHQALVHLVAGGTKVVGGSVASLVGLPCSSTISPEGVHFAEEEEQRNLGTRK